jgi:hypothetical protein
MAKLSSKRRHERPAKPRRSSSTLARRPTAAKPHTDANQVPGPALLPAFIEPSLALLTNTPPTGHRLPRLTSSRNVGLLAAGTHGDF